MIPSPTSAATLCETCPLLNSEENRSLPDQVRSGFVHRLRLCRHASVTQAESGHRLLVLRTGAIKAERLSPSGDVEVMGFYFPEDSIALSARAQVPILLTALSATELCEIEIDKATQCLPDGAGFLRAAIEVAMQQIATEQDRSQRARTGSARDRLAASLADCAERSSVTGGGELMLPMSREDLARYLAMRPETLSRAFADLRSEGGSRRRLALSSGSFRRTSRSAEGRFEVRFRETKTDDRIWRPTAGHRRLRAPALSSSSCRDAPGGGRGRLSRGTRREES